MRAQAKPTGALYLFWEYFVIRKFGYILPFPSVN
jgi:hypothetical protein